MPVSRFLGRALLAVTVGFAAACSDSTGPGSTSTLDTDAAMNRMEPVAAVLEQPVFTSLQGAGEYLGEFGLGPVASLTTKLTRSGFDPRILRNLAPSAPKAAAVVPNTVKGTTYIYDEGSASYVPAVDATGAPAAGVRVILYAWDPLAGAPASPLNRVGYVDLIDESTSSTDVLRVRLVRDEGSAILADYTISHSLTIDRETFGINGSANNGTTTVNFDLDFVAEGEVMSASFHISAPSQGASMSLELSSDPVAGTNDIGLAFGFDGHTLTFDLRATADETAMGEVKLDGRLYATFTADSTAQVWEKADGTPLTADERERLGLLLGRGLEITGIWMWLVWPMDMFVAT